MFDVAFLDFNKTFDAVPHSNLLERLSTCEISRFPVHWVKSWLKGRTDRAVEKLHLAAIQPAVVSLRAQFQGQFCSVFLSMICMNDVKAPLTSSLLIPN